MDKQYWGKSVMNRVLMDTKENLRAKEVILDRAPLTDEEVQSFISRLKQRAELLKKNEPKQLQVSRNEKEVPRFSINNLLSEHLSVLAQSIEERKEKGDTLYYTDIASLHSTLIGEDGFKDSKKKFWDYQHNRVNKIVLTDPELIAIKDAPALQELRTRIPDQDERIQYLANNSKTDPNFAKMDAMVRAGYQKARENLKFDQLGGVVRKRFSAELNTIIAETLGFSAPQKERG